jgi:hypothetical protein
MLDEPEVIERRIRKHLAGSYGLENVDSDALKIKVEDLLYQYRMADTDKAKYDAYKGDDDLRDLLEEYDLGLEVW